MECDFQDKYACGYVIEGDPFQWQLHSGLDVTDSIGPNTDHENSVLGKIIALHLLQLLSAVDI